MVNNEENKGKIGIGIIGRKNSIHRQRMVNNGPIPPNTDEKVLKKIQKYKQK